MRIGCVKEEVKLSSLLVLSGDVRPETTLNIPAL
jgi:hypothetical protein